MIRKREEQRESKGAEYFYNIICPEFEMEFIDGEHIKVQYPINPEYRHLCNEYDLLSNHDYEESIVRFAIIIDGKREIITGRTHDNNRYNVDNRYNDNTNFYNGYYLNKNIRYINGKWFHMTDDILQKTINNKDYIIALQMLEYAESFSRDILVKSLIKVMNENSKSDLNIESNVNPNAKKRKTTNFY